MRKKILDKPLSNINNQVQLAEAVDRYASQCVKCALCLPHCPTYELTQDENESPRGRIALFQAIAQEKLPLTAKVSKHLDQCLGCRACERVCPAHVEYGHLLTLGRGLQKQLPTKQPLPQHPFSVRFLSWILTKPILTRYLHWLLWLMDVTYLRKLARSLKLPALLHLANLDAILPTLTKPCRFKSYYEAMGAKQGELLLFTGCVSSLCDQETLAASIYILRKLGFAVHIPRDQTCCSAIALHAGDLTGAHQLAEKNKVALINNFPKVNYIITTATGCSAVLEEIPDFSNGAVKVIDIVSFVIKQSWPPQLDLKPLPFNVILHTPCTRRNVLKTPNDPELLLAKIPQLTWQIIKSPHCCGAAGTYMLEHPKLAEPLAQKLLSELDNIPFNFLATTNIGCALHLQNQWNKSASRTQSPMHIGHPITLFARSLGFSF